MISVAYAQAQGGPPGGEFLTLLPLILMFVLLYFLMIRPQMKHKKEHKTMLEALQKGDEIIAAGLLGKITKVSDVYVSVEIADNVVVQVQKQAVTTLLPRGTVKSAS